MPTIERTLIGGVGYRWQRDASLGLVLIDELARDAWPPSVECADLGYGAIYAAQDLADAQPPYTRLILVAAVEHGDEPGSVRRYRYNGRLPSDEEIHARVREAGAGVIDLDHLLVIAQHMNALPRDVVVFEVEPFEIGASVELSEPATRLLATLRDRVRAEALGDRVVFGA